MRQPGRDPGNLSELLLKAAKVAKTDNQPALAQADGARWWAELAQRDGMAARALEFLTLTAARSGEVRGMVWEEVALGPADGEGGHPAAVWTIPAARMKAGRAHRVPLTPGAVALLKALPRMDGSPCPGGG